jgi:ribosomal protein S18 acetylase RimI-like enzyme
MPQRSPQSQSQHAPLRDRLSLRRTAVLDAADRSEKLGPSPSMRFNPNLVQLPVQSAPEPAPILQRSPSGHGGRSISPPVRHKMERAFNTSFADVRVHEGNHAHSLGAIAYTQSNHIHFAPGKYNPDTSSGQALLGHELAHVVQQRQGRVKPTGQVKGLPLNDNPALEQEADRLGLRAAQSHPIVQRKPDTNRQTAQYNIASPKLSNDGYQEITAISSDNRQPIGRVKIKGSPMQQKMEIASLWVEPKHRHQGVSKSLIGAATQAGKQQGYRQAKLGVDPEAPGMNTSTLESIYARQGFKRTGTVGKNNPLMERSL